MASDKRSIDRFSLDSSEDEAVYDGENSTTIDDSYLSGLSERMGKEPSFMPSGSDLFGESSGNPLAISSFSVPRMEDPVSAGQDPQGTDDIIELDNDALEPIDEELPAGGPPADPYGAGLDGYGYAPQGYGNAEAVGDAIEGPLRPGPSDLLQSVPPAPEDPEPLDPELNPATYDAPTFVRPSLIEQDPVPVIEIVQGNEKGRSYRFERSSMSIGRGLDNDVVLTDIAVSRRHVKMTRNGNEITIEDLGSGNGTVVNGSKIQTSVVSGADRIEVGNTVFRLSFPGQDSHPPQPLSSEPPPPQPSGPLHHKSTMYLSDGSHVMEQVGAASQPPGAGPNVIVAGAPPAEGTPSASYPSQGQSAGAGAHGVPRSFKIAMVGLMVLVVLIAFVAFFAAISLRQNLERTGPTAEAAATSQPSAEDLFREGRLHFVEKRWGQAAEAFEGVLALSPDHEQAQEYLTQARAEQRNQGSLAAAEQAIDDENFEGAITTLKTIPTSSTYYAKASELKSRAVRGQAGDIATQARELIEAGETNQARSLLEKAREADPLNSDVRQLLARLDGEGDGGETEEPGDDEPAKATPPRVAANRPPASQRPTPRERSTPRPQRSKRSSSSALGSVLAHYKAGRFDAATRRAQELAASAGSSTDRAKARNMANQIGRFAKAWNGSKSTTNSRQKLSYLESALRLDRQISGGYYAGKIRPSLLKVYESNAQRAWRAGQYATACQNAIRASRIDRGSSVASSLSQRCESKAREFYTQGERLRRSDLNQAKSYWRKVLGMVPNNSATYRKAYEALNNAGRRRYQDEDE